MAGWDTSMPLDFTDGLMVDEGDLDPIVNNVNWLRYATVFVGGQRRVTTIPSIDTTEVGVLQTPTVTFEAGYLYEVRGMYKWQPAAAGCVIELRVHEGAGIGGAVPQSFASPAASGAALGQVTPFSVYIKTLSTVSRPYTLGTRRIAGTGLHTADVTGWIAVLRSGDNALMTDA
jgi:hypothetical protein